MCCGALVSKRAGGRKASQHVRGERADRKLRVRRRAKQLLHDDGRASRGVRGCGFQGVMVGVAALSVWYTQPAFDPVVGSFVLIGLQDPRLANGFNAVGFSQVRECVNGSHASERGAATGLNPMRCAGQPAHPRLHPAAQHASSSELCVVPRTACWRRRSPSMHSDAIHLQRDQQSASALDLCPAILWKVTN